ncbi:MAG: ERCC4 domain-containing protein [Desulfurococcaceae archaeon TW002]
MRVYVDEREKSSEIPYYLLSMGVSVIFKVLEVGDYIINDLIVLERKRLDDLIKSVYEGRFFDQLKRLKSLEGFKAVLVVEGDLLSIDEYVENPRSIEAALVSAILSFNVPILYTRNSRHTAELIKYIAEKTQEVSRKAPIPLPTYRRSKKLKTSDLRAWQIYVLSSFPKIGPTLAERLLHKFGSLKAVINAQVTELVRVDGMSEDKAKLFKKIVEEGSQSAAGTSLDKFISKK